MHRVGGVGGCVFMGDMYLCGMAVAGGHVCVWDGDTGGWGCVGYGCVGGWAHVWV